MAALHYSKQSYLFENIELGRKNINFCISETYGKFYNLKLLLYYAKLAYRRTIGTPCL